MSDVLLYLGFEILHLCSQFSMPPLQSGATTALLVDWLMDRQPGFDAWMA